MYKMAHELRENLLLGIGHPLLDITAKVEKDFLEKYNLKENDAIIMSEKHEDLYKELLEKYQVNYTLGGSVQNTLRIVQWLTEKPKLTTFFGAVGKDKMSEILRNKATIDGVNVRYQYIDSEPTGTCLVLITDENRSLCTNPGSSKFFDIEHIKEAENKCLFEAAEFYYMVGFFLSVSPATLIAIAKKAASHSRQFLFNLSAPFICQNYKDNLMELIPYIDVIFGNTSEIKALFEVCQFKTECTEDMVQILAQYQKINKTTPRIIVVTDGDNPVTVGTKNEILKFPVPKIKKENIVDTNGAGDAFVGGFLSQYIQEKDLEQCVACGIWTASQIIKKTGCTFEGKSSFHL